MMRARTGETSKTLLSGSLQHMVMREGVAVKSMLALGGASEVVVGLRGAFPVPFVGPKPCGRARIRVRYRHRPCCSGCCRLGLRWLTPSRRVSALVTPPASLKSPC
ncbi:uncharacterized protein BKA78DRAFT_325789 [Phyllosticta capitalensis]|uniref:uncharacterized protein n=1 Tax=Phyllosticta capitalensis TaxID=121624 RepID=UPI00312D382C